MLRLSSGSNLGKAEIGELDDGLGLVEITIKEVFRFEISMDDPVLVAVEYCLCHLYYAVSRLVFCVMVLCAIRKTHGSGIRKREHYQRMHVKQWLREVGGGGVGAGGMGGGG